MYPLAPSWVCLLCFTIRGFFISFTVCFGSFSLVWKFPTFLVGILHHLIAHLSNTLGLNSSSLFSKRDGSIYGIALFLVQEDRLLFFGRLHCRLLTFMPWILLDSQWVWEVHIFFWPTFMFCKKRKDGSLWEDFKDGFATNHVTILLR